MVFLEPFFQYVVDQRTAPRIARLRIDRLKHGQAQYALGVKGIWIGLQLVKIGDRQIDMPLLGVGHGGWPGREINAF